MRGAGEEGMEIQKVEPLCVTLVKPLSLSDSLIFVPIKERGYKRWLLL